MMHEVTLKRLFREYLMNKCGITYATAISYTSYLNKVSKLLKDYKLINKDIYKIRDLHRLLQAKIDAESLDEFYIMNSKSHNQCSCSLNHYYDFAATVDEFSHKWKNSLIY